MNIDELKGIIEAITPLVSDVTDSATLIAALYIGFKLLIELLIPILLIALAYKALQFVKQWALKQKTVTTVVELSLDGDLISTDKNVNENLKEAFRLARLDSGLYASDYIHRQHSAFILDAVREKVINDKEQL